jgi:DnaJ-class molecular chaperone
MYNDNINNIDLYAILELNKNCSKNDIRKSYKRLILKYHPDKHCDANNSSNNNINNMFVQVKYAYEILYDDNKRFKYDLYTHNNKETPSANMASAVEQLITLIKKKDIAEIIKFVSSIKNIDYEKFVQAIIMKDYNYIINVVFNNNNNNNNIDIIKNYDCSLRKVYNNHKINVSFERNTRPTFNKIISPRSVIYKGEGEEGCGAEGAEGAFGNVYINVNISKKMYFGITYNILNNDIYTSFANIYITNNILEFTFIDKNIYKFDISTLNKHVSDIGYMYYIENMGLLIDDTSTQRGNLFFIICS